MCVDDLAYSHYLFTYNLLFVRIPVWYDVKLAFVAWLVLPQYKGGAFIYEKFVREKIMKKFGGIDRHNKSPNNLLTS
ncbi:hypothetical protein RJ639_006190 [Escallonia herrerae]|uniref:HVA22-like protein n=1 Tax=Escallonia herrerae TaxID=1293975 RepID=A0AA89AVW7_9ASTE|nr:hypothetical protein RJ639_006190 [Escallonia herrerae]